MNKIDEIALRVAAEIGAVSYSPPPFRAVRGYSFTYDDLWRFTRALVADPELLAELSKDAEPVAIADGTFNHNCELGTPLFTRPAPVIASEQKPVDLRALCIEDENAFMQVLANRIAGNAYPEEDARLEVAYAIARYLKLDWPSAYEQEPVAIADCHEVHGSLCQFLNRTPYGMKTIKDGDKLFTSPPNTADIEQRVAEAIAKMIQGWSCTNGPSIAEAIRSGKWREYL